MSATHIYTDMFVFFDVFINHFMKIQRSVFHKITLDLLYFWGIYNINLWENKLLAEAQLVHAVSSFQGKKDLQHRCVPVEFVNFQEQWWLLLKTCNIIYIIKKYIGHKLAIINTILLLYCIYRWPDDDTWDSSMMWCYFERNKQTAKMCAWNKMKYCSWCVILIRIEMKRSIGHVALH